MEDKKIVSLIDRYLSRHAVKGTLLDQKPDPDLNQIIVIPAFEEESLLPALKSLYACDRQKHSAEVIVVFNASENNEPISLALNKKAEEELNEWYSSLSKPWFKLQLIVEDKLPQKHAGVGLARKIGMDEAVRRFKKLGKDGLIVCFDADSKCLPNYLKAIERHFEVNEKTSACSIYFEHPLSGNEYNDSVYQGITAYELHLRYYKQALAFAALPYAYHTVGSSMAVRASAYCTQGGMNKRKAGEDFYFLQKFIKLGNFSELNTTKVIPSPRPSHRVPFGTGRAIAEMQENNRELNISYAWENFLILKEACHKVEKWYQGEVSTHPLLVQFHGQLKWEKAIEEIRANSSSAEIFKNRFFKWFDAFQCLKFMHFLRDVHAPQKPLLKEVPKLLRACGNENTNQQESLHSLLLQLRKIDQKAGSNFG